MAATTMAASDAEGGRKRPFFASAAAFAHSPASCSQRARGMCAAWSFGGGERAARATPLRPRASRAAVSWQHAVDGGAAAPARLCFQQTPPTRAAPPDAAPPDAARRRAAARRVVRQCCARARANAERDAASRVPPPLDGRRKRLRGPSKTRAFVRNILSCSKLLRVRFMRVFSSFSVLAERRIAQPAAKTAKSTARITMTSETSPGVELSEQIPLTDPTPADAAATAEKKKSWFTKKVSAARRAFARYRRPAIGDPQAAASLATPAAVSNESRRTRDDFRRVARAKTFAASHARRLSPQRPLSVARATAALNRKRCQDDESRRRVAAHERLLPVARSSKLQLQTNKEAGDGQEKENGAETAAFGKKSQWWQKTPKCATTDSQNPSFGIDYTRRDAEQLQTAVDLGFEHIFGEPDSNHSFNAVWRSTNSIFLGVRCFFYKARLEIAR